MDYLLDAVGKRDLFSLLKMDPERFWHSLLFRDRFNYLGILADIPAQLQESLTNHPGALTQVSSPSPHSFLWPLVTRRPPGVTYHNLHSRHVQKASLAPAKGHSSHLRRDMGRNTITCTRAGQHSTGLHMPDPFPQGPC